MNTVCGVDHYARKDSSKSSTPIILRCHFMCSRMQMVLHIMAAQSTFKYLAESMDYLYTA